jgi:hypothetical protein
MNDKTVPTCFGRHWDGDAPECKGGLDPAYAHPISDSCVRPPCNWYATCGATYCNRVKAVPAQPMTPTQHRPPPQPQPYQQTSYPQTSYPQTRQQTYVQHVPAPQPAPVQYAQPQQTQLQQIQQPQQMQPQAGPGQRVMYINGVPYGPVDAAATPPMVPMATVMPGVQAQSFLSVPESGNGAGAFWASIVRGMSKGGLQMALHRIDYFPLGW